MSKMDILAVIAGQYGGVIETKVAVKHGVSRATLSMYCKQNKIRRMHTGVYIMPEKEKDEYHSFSQKGKEFVFSHDTALFLNKKLSDEPVRPSVTIPTGITPTVMLSSACDVYYIKRSLFELGKTKVKTVYGNEVFVYDYERTICDMVRSYKRVGEEKVFEAVKVYLADERKNVKKLFAYAEQFHISLRMYKIWNQAKAEMENGSVADAIIE